ncbi:phosphohistidine phosphatase SixA [Oscillatoria amoena NRMC-F 0135]|uniref:Phosphohistidine phosphatase SixA n=1 Tax=Geitlerinema calcuttense NRMC-F 0142 TaxID=2922238 RepID=A0ABT7LX41_9CYAN|nr:phosphohistidine phosphatase SixA [Geitlerinema calcuttense]MDI9638358.1 phosphohistidine phosphatase SixA [Geitlerinema splendidum]MDL5045633.1 phosphohistidine phosphatase SixA [Oscillatoria amoena NRMC-F 0135]MDL5056132.1 phosphohistidine phosphatase SixA [Geitlerinema calcuttense NRMC-F 0142]
MELYLIRHGIAADREAYERDRDRPLTEEGRKKTQKVAKRLRSLDLNFDLILTSPLIRARQTAEILLSQHLAPLLQESEHLAPEGELQAWLAWLNSKTAPQGQRLALVGHQPNLGDWTETLVWGTPKGAIAVKKAGVIGLELPNPDAPIGRSTLFWLSPPRMLLS